MIDRLNQPFERSGIAALSDLRSDAWRSIYSLLEKEQETFLAQEDRFRSPQYKWPRDPLHTWSRVWEYPYVYQNLQRWRECGQESTNPRAVDVGSGVTFFPFSVARLGYHVTGVDIDPVVGIDLPKAAEIIDHGPGEVDCRVCDDSRLPFADHEVDVVYSISVLEHIPDIEHAIKEVFRVLKPNGLFILTIDLDLCGYMEIGSSRYDALRRCLSEHFVFTEPEITVHPLDVLQPRNGPFPGLIYPTWRRWAFSIAQRLKPFLGRKRFRVLPNLAVWGGVMLKEDTA